MSTLTIEAATGPRGLMAKTGALVAGTAFAGAALFGGVAVAPTVASGLAASAHHDYVLTADGTLPVITDFVGSLQYLLDEFNIGNIGQVLALFGDDAEDNPIGVGTNLSVLLAALNPVGSDGTSVSLNELSGGLLGQDLTALLSGIEIGGAPLGDVPIDTLLGGIIGGADGIDTSVGALLTQLGLGPYVGLLNLSFLGIDLLNHPGSDAHRLLVCSL